MEPVRELGMNIANVQTGTNHETFTSKENIRAIMYQDFKNAAQNIRPSVSKESLKLYEQWNKEFGSK